MRLDELAGVSAARLKGDYLWPWTATFKSVLIVTAQVIPLLLYYTEMVKKLISFFCQGSSQGPLHPGTMRVEAGRQENARHVTFHVDPFLKII
jgi:hypothetical protein